MHRAVVQYKHSGKRGISNKLLSVGLVGETTPLLKLFQKLSLPTSNYNFKLITVNFTLFTIFCPPMVKINSARVVGRFTQFRNYTTRTLRKYWFLIIKNTLCLNSFIGNENNRRLVHIYLSEKDKIYYLIFWKYFQISLFDHFHLMIWRLWRLFGDDIHVVTRHECKIEFSDIFYISSSFLCTFGLKFAKSVPKNICFK